MKGKLAGLIEALNSTERVQFRKSLVLEGNATERLLRLYDHFPAPEEDEEKEALFKTCFPGEAYDDKKLRYLKTDLTGRIEDFIAHRALASNPDLYRQVLLRELADRGAGKAYHALQLDRKKSGEDSPLRDADHYYDVFYSEFVHLAYAGRLRRDEMSNIETVVGQLDRFYLARKLQLCCEIFNVRNVLAVDYKVFLLDEILGHLRNTSGGGNSYEDTPVIRIYYQILMMLLESEKEEHFLRLRELLREHREAFTLSELREMYQHVLNYCIRRINLGDISYQETLFEIYRETLGNRVLLHDGHLSQWDYKNIVTVSLRQKAYEWTFKFIHEYRDQMLPAERENAFIYNLAFLHFNKGEYSKALQLLQQVEFTDLYYQLDSRVILLKSYFETDDVETFFYHVAAFKTFLHRNKMVSEYQRTIYLNLVKYTARLLRAGTAPKKIALVKQQVEADRQVADLAWLLSKMEERE